jgi:hypothetical protein
MAEEEEWEEEYEEVWVDEDDVAGEINDSWSRGVPSSYSGDATFAQKVQTSTQAQYPYSSSVPSSQSSQPGQIHHQVSSTYDKFRPLSQIISEIGSKMSRLSEEERTTYIQCTTYLVRSLGLEDIITTCKIPNVLDRPPSSLKNIESAVDGMQGESGRRLSFEQSAKAEALADSRKSKAEIAVLRSRLARVEARAEAAEAALRRSGSHDESLIFSEQALKAALNAVEYAERQVANAKASGLAARNAASAEAGRWVSDMQVATATLSMSGGISSGASVAGDGGISSMLSSTDASSTHMHQLSAALRSSLTDEAGRWSIEISSASSEWNDAVAARNAMLRRQVTSLARSSEGAAATASRAVDRAVEVLDQEMRSASAAAVEQMEAACDAARQKAMYRLREVAGGSASQLAETSRQSFVALLNGMSQEDGSQGLSLDPAHSALAAMETRRRAFTAGLISQVDAFEAQLPRGESTGGGDHPNPPGSMGGGGGGGGGDSMWMRRQGSMAIAAAEREASRWESCNERLSESEDTLKDAASWLREALEGKVAEAKLERQVKEQRDRQKVQLEAERAALQREQEAITAKQQRVRAEAEQLAEQLRSREKETALRLSQPTPEMTMLPQPLSETMIHPQVTQPPIPLVESPLPQPLPSTHTQSPSSPPTAPSAVPTTAVVPVAVPTPTPEAPPLVVETMVGEEGEKEKEKDQPPPQGNSVRPRRRRPPTKTAEVDASPSAAEKDTTKEDEKEGETNPNSSVAEASFFEPSPEVVIPVVAPSGSGGRKPRRRGKGASDAAGGGALIEDPFGGGGDLPF